MTKRNSWLVALGAAALGLAACRSAAKAPAAPAGEFSQLTIDLGVVVGDIGKSAKFYTEAVGFKEVSGFDVPAFMGADSGLSDNKAFSVRVFVLGEGPGATNLKLMQFKDAPGKKADNTFIHSTLGYSYITIFVNDTAAAMERLAKAGVKPIAKGPYLLPEGFPKGIYLTCVKDPDGNMVELVGPKK